MSFPDDIKEEEQMYDAFDMKGDFDYDKKDQSMPYNLMGTPQASAGSFVEDVYQPVYQRQHQYSQNPRNSLPLLTTTFSPSQGHLSPHPRSATSAHTYQSDYNSNSLSLPYSPGGVSYESDQSNSPFVDAASNFDSRESYFDTEIALGGSVSNTNLAAMNRGNGPYTNHTSNNGPYTNHPSNERMDLVHPSNEDFSRTMEEAFPMLTENNLLYNNHTLNVPTQENIDSIFQNDIVISIHQAPEAPETIAAKTPSLFSNSSASSLQNSPRNQSEATQLLPNSQFVSSTSESLLKPDDSSIRLGRRKSHSVSSRRSNSRSARSSDVEDDDEYEDDDDDESKPKQKVSSRQKMLELASPAQCAKRTQKHPSVYACHLCEKRFTRPYNLKSHLRTHTDERPFICNVCGKAFARQHDRKRHEELHTGEKKFQCKGFLRDGTEYGCGRKFARADALRRHFQTENGKACIKLLIEEEERDKVVKTDNPNGVTNGKTANDFLMSVPSVVFSPPE